MKNEKRYYTVVKGDNDTKLNAVPIVLNYKQNIKSLSMICHSVHIDTSMTDLDLNQIEEESVIRYILLLPEIYEFGKKDKYKDSLYSLIDLMWCHSHECQKEMVVSRKLFIFIFYFAL